jgi:hypothetical protein
MAHKGNVEESKKEPKPRGRPFPKNNGRGKPKDQILDADRCDKDIKGGVVEYGNSIPIIVPSVMTFKTFDEIVKENMKKTKTDEELNESADKSSDLEIIESIDFTSGPNKLSIRFSKKHNRMFRIQVFLNDIYQVRPVTYTGSTTGVTFWNMLKGVLKK